MARALRIEFENAFYHVMSRGNEAREIFKEEADRERFLSLFEEIYPRYHAIIYAYTLMNNHYHLLIETEEANLSKIMHHINVSYSVYFNRNHKRQGHLLQGRYKGLIVDKESYLLELSRYIHLNPVRAGLVTRPEDYNWSSYRYYLKGKGPEWLNIEWIVARFGVGRYSAFSGYKEFVEEGLRQKIKNPFMDALGGIILGGKGFIEKIKDKIKIEGSSEVSGVRSLTKSYSLEVIAEEISDHFNIETKELRERRRNFLPKRVAIYFARKLSPFSIARIGEYFDISPAAVSKTVRRIEDDKVVKEEIERIKGKVKF